ncbi:MAG: AAA family ATPase [Acidimicrobiales bacterium]|nr:AAA family ATPase [Acidimicrobiales bacterium]
MGVVEELSAEQRHVDRANARLDGLHSGVSSLSEEVIALGRGGSVADRVDRDARVQLSLGRRATLSIGDRPLCFGRLDLDGRERLHIGRLGVSDEAGEPLMVDWRAPVAEAFYRATSADRRGVTRRRHIRMKGRRVVGVDDELLARPGSGAGSGLVGEAALLSSLEQSRTGRMGDIVATIQAEQDAAIRAPLPGVLVVQGGPGTGKTAVALHRAAYLLYAHHFPLASQGVLVVGPNPVFCRYVGDVLPGLGETGVRLSTPADLVSTPAGARLAADPLDVSAVKADLAMAKHVWQAVRSHQRPLEEVAHVPYSIHRLAVTPADSARLVASAGEEPTHRAGRVKLEGLLLRYLWRRVEQARRRATRAGLVRRPTPGRTSVIDQLRRSTEVRALADWMWPELTPEAVVHEALRAAGIEPSSGWSEHDLALLDEAEALIGPPITPHRRRRRHASGLDDALERTLSSLGHLPECPSCRSELTLSAGRWQCEHPRCQKTWRTEQVMSPEAFQQVREITERVSDTHHELDPERPTSGTFGHVIVDEAQDLTPMQWRMIARRCPTGSMTLVGDMGQAKHPWSARSWSGVCALAAPNGPHRVLELTINYRTPEEVMGLAASVLADVAPDLQPPVAVRRCGQDPVVTVTSADGLARSAREAARCELEVVAPGKVAIIHPPGGVDDVDADVLDLSVAELDVERAKGLEFDSVVVVEPAAHSAGQLYVALTRTTRRLVLVHSRPLPAALHPMARAAS